MDKAKEGESIHRSINSHWTGAGLRMQLFTARGKERPGHQEGEVAEGSDLTVGENSQCICFSSVGD